LKCFFLILFLATFAGCADDIRHDYGRRTGAEAESVNGTSVFADMFEAAGHRVSSTTYLAPRVARRADVIVWIPNDFHPPDEEHRQWFETWLYGAADRVLIYVGRDFDAEPHYWKSVKIGAPVDQQIEFAARLKEAEQRYEQDHDDMPDDEDANWFICRGKSQPRAVTTLAGDPHWIDDIDPKKLGIRLNGRLVPPAPPVIKPSTNKRAAANTKNTSKPSLSIPPAPVTTPNTAPKPSAPTATSPSAKAQQPLAPKAAKSSTTVLIESEGDAILTRRKFGDSQLFVVTNGSLLLNLPLVNHEHRKLAGRLIDACGEDRRVVFVESSRPGPKIHEKDPNTSQRSGLQIFTIEPFDLVLWHLCVLGLIFCLSRFPIFGRPRSGDAPETSDFQKHIAALGALIARSHDRASAQARIDHYLRSNPATRTHESSSSTSQPSHTT
jgi:hypothetical protein